jgi:hypothetical protein
MAASRVPYPHPGWGIFFALPARSSSRPPDVNLITAGLPGAYDLVGTLGESGSFPPRQGIGLRP